MEERNKCWQTCKECQELRYELDHIIRRARIEILFAMGLIGALTVLIFWVGTK